MCCCCDLDREESSDSNEGPGQGASCLAFASVGSLETMSASSPGSLLWAKGVWVCFLKNQGVFHPSTLGCCPNSGWCGLILASLTTTINDHLQTVKVDVFDPDGARLNEGVAVLHCNAHTSSKNAPEVALNLEFVMQWAYSPSWVSVSQETMRHW